MNLCDGFDNRARRTWNRMKKAYKYRMVLSEETITELNLLFLRHNCPKQIITLQPSKIVEGREGADWEMVIISGKHTLPLLVQAKKLSPANLQYPQLSHPIKKGPYAGKHQVDLLISTSQNKWPGWKCVPLYVFYNYWETRSVPANWFRHVRPWGTSSYGCGIAHALDIRNLILSNKNSLREVSQYMVPWTYLVCPPIPFPLPTPGPPPSNLVEMAYDALRFLSAEAMQELVGNGSILNQHPPPHVQKAIEEGRLSDEEFEESGLNHLTLIRDES